MRLADRDGAADLYRHLDDPGPSRPAQAPGEAGALPLHRPHGRDRPELDRPLRAACAQALPYGVHRRLDADLRKGTSGCHARFVVSPPAGATYFRPVGGEIKCDGPCGKKLTGKKTFTIFGGVSLDHKHRAGKTITLQVERFCQGRKLIVPQSFEIVFNSQGFVDKKKSGFVAKTR